jgi:hypothetical protein
MADFDDDLKALLAQFSVPQGVQAKLKDGANPCIKLWQFAEYVDDVRDWTAFCAGLEPAITDRTLVANVRRAFKAAGERDSQALKRGSQSVADDFDSPIDHTTRKELIAAHAAYYRFVIAARRSPSDTLLGRLHRERERSAFSVIVLLKVTSVANQEVHTKHINVAEGMAFSFASHNEFPDGQATKGLNLAQWIRALTIVYNGYSIVGLRKSPNQAGWQVIWCS